MTEINPTELLDPTNPDDAKSLSTEAAMQSQGVDPFTAQPQAVYFGFGEFLHAMFPDGISYLEHKTLNEGERTQYNKSLKRTVRVQNVTRDALMETPSGEERSILFQVAVKGWYVLGPDRKEMAFSLANLNRLILESDPKVVDHLYKQIQEANPWLMADVTIEDIDAEIENLQQMRARKVEEEAAKNGLSR